MMLSRFFSSILLVAFLYVVVFRKEPAAEMLFIGGASLMAFCLAREISHLLKNMGLEGIGIRTSIYALIYFLLVAGSKFIAKNEIVFFAAINLVFAIIMWGEILVSSGDRDKLRKTLVSASVFFLVIMPLSCLVMIYMFRFGNVDGKKAFFYLVAVTKAGDIGGYLGGMASSALLRGGNHKILPRISPKKSWEGTFCGMIFSVVASIILAEHMQIFGRGEFAIPMGLTLFIGGFFGDLAESSMKRAAEIKDSGKVIPGIGGIFDLVDSFMLNGPIFYILLMMKAII